MKKVRREIQVSFNSPEEKKERVYEDKFTEELSTLDEVKERLEETEIFAPISSNGETYSIGGNQGSPNIFWLAI